MKNYLKISLLGLLLLFATLSFANANTPLLDYGEDVKTELSTKEVLLQSECDLFQETILLDITSHKEAMCYMVQPSSAKENNSVNRFLRLYPPRSHDNMMMAMDKERVLYWHLGFIPLFRL